MRPHNCPTATCEPHSETCRRGGGISAGDDEGQRADGKAYGQEEGGVEGAAADVEEAGGGVGEAGAEDAGEEDGAGEDQDAVAPVVEGQDDQTGRCDQKRQDQGPFTAALSLSCHLHFTLFSFRAGGVSDPGSLRQWDSAAISALLFSVRAAT